MRVLLLSSILIWVSISCLKAQKLKEEITYQPKKGIYKVHYWSGSDSTFYTVPLFPGNKHQPCLKASVNYKEGKYTYIYKLSNKEQSLRELYTFSISTQSEVHNVQVPNQAWSGSYIKWMEKVRWSQIHSESDTLGTLPGENIPGEFTFESKSVPGLTIANSSSYHRLGNTKDEGPSGRMRVKIDSLLNASEYVEIKTIGPKRTPEVINNKKLLDKIRYYLRFSCDTTWIKNRENCNELDAELKKAQMELKRENLTIAQEHLRLFLDKLDKMNQKQISSEAYGLLFYNGQYVSNTIE